jgi:hypothetical protein
MHPVREPGRKLGLPKLDLYDRIAAAVDAADLDPDQTDLPEKLSTLSIDKPMRAHTLMQAIARANRVVYRHIWQQSVSERLCTAP